MQAFEEKTIILSFDEVRILLYSQGFTTCEGIYMPRKEYTPQEILQTVYGMEKRGLLTVEDVEDEQDSAPGAGFIMKPDLQRMVLAMGNPGGTFEYRPGENLPGFSKELYNGPEYFCYMLPDYCLVAEKDWTRTRSLRLRAMDLPSFTAWRQEREEEAKEQSLLTEDGHTGQMVVNASEKTDQSSETEKGPVLPEHELQDRINQSLDAILE